MITMSRATVGVRRSSAPRCTPIMMVYDEKSTRAVFRLIVEGETKSGYDGEYNSELLKGCGVRWRVGMGREGKK